MEVKKSSSEDKMLDIAHEIAKMLVQEQQNIQPNKDGIRSELGKVIAYLRHAIAQNKSDAGSNFFKYLAILVNNSKSLQHSDITPEYYRCIDKVCGEKLTDLQSNPEKILEILGWVSRLFNYYKFTPLEDFNKLSLLSRQMEIQTVAKSQSLQVDDEIDAEITRINGKKVTYQLLKIFSKTVKEDKHYLSLKVGQVVVVKIIEIEDGVPKKVKYVKTK